MSYRFNVTYSLYPLYAVLAVVLIGLFFLYLHDRGKEKEFLRQFGFKPESPMTEMQEKAVLNEVTRRHQAFIEAMVTYRRMSERFASTGLLHSTLSQQSLNYYAFEEEWTAFCYDTAKSAVEPFASEQFKVKLKEATTEIHRQDA